MRLLLDSLNCNPNLGSNSESGFGFVREAAKRHHVILLTHRDIFQQAGNRFDTEPLNDVSVCAVEPGLWRRLGCQSDYLLQSYTQGRHIIRRTKIDAIHSIEPNQYLLPRPLAFLKRPFVLGPLHGGAAYPNTSFLEDLSRNRYPTGFHLPKRDAILRLRLAGAFNQALVYGSLSRRLTEWAVRRAARIVLGTQNVLQHIPEKYHAKVSFISSMGVDLERFSPKKRTENRCPVVLFAARITPVKGLDFLIRAFAKVVKERDMLLKIVGSGAGHPEDEAYESYCRGLVEEYGLSELIDFAGAETREQLIRHYRAADIFCLPSLWETFGAVYLEAMACGLPIIAVNAGGPREIIEPHFGIRIIPESVHQLIDELADSLVAMAADPTMRCEMGRQARLHAEKCYDWQVLGEQMEKVYQSL
ncbi:MAG: hypothetical protein A2293_15825 [Elusimicrobia bacterium RIFOXYB2_FULL_49_7]|nr:MAG: hypothetical protein A2293_15825 [Elusimicrobia bacterium RIFOXYB2_FULL_49_7]